MKKRRAVMAAVAALCAGVVAVGLAGCEWFSFGKNKPKNVADKLGYEGSDTAAWLTSYSTNGDSAFLTPALRSSVAIAVPPSSVGSGVIYSTKKNDEGNTDAYIITNYHVLNHNGSIAKTCYVFLYGDKYEPSVTLENALQATYVGGSESEDIAVLSVELDAERAAFVLPVCGDGNQAVGVRDSDGAKAGERVYAVGNPLGKGISVVSGTVSVEAEYVGSMLSMRIDAPVTHGNSGGGLFDKDGKFAGIVYGGQDVIVKVKEEDANGKIEWVEQPISIAGFGYAIPANRAVSVAQSILDSTAAVGKKEATRGRLGMLEIRASKGVYVNNTVEIVEEVVITELDANSPFDGNVLNKVLKGIVVLDARGNNVIGGGVSGFKEIARKHQVESILFNLRTGFQVTLIFDGGEQITATYNTNGNFAKA